MYFYKVMVKGKFGISCYNYIKSKISLTTPEGIIDAVDNIENKEGTIFNSFFSKYLKIIKCTHLWVEKISFFEYYKDIFLEWYYA